MKQELEEAKQKSEMGSDKPVKTSSVLDKKTITPELEHFSAAQVSQIVAVAAGSITERNDHSVKESNNDE